MGCCAKIAQIVLVVINTLVFLCGLAMIGVGIALRLATDETIGWLTDILGSVLDWGVLAAAFYLMIGIGLFLVLVGFFGCCGACKKSSCMLTIYIIMVIIILTLQIAGGILAAVFLGFLDETIEEAMQENLQTEYSKATAVTSSWDNMQFELKCCGSVDYLDYRTSFYFSDTGNTVPPSCCTNATRRGGDVEIGSAEWTSCKTAAAASSTESGLFHVKGCYQTWYDWIITYIDVLIGVMVGLGVLQVITIIFACCVLKQDNDFV